MFCSPISTSFQSGSPSKETEDGVKQAQHERIKKELFPFVLSLSKDTNSFKKEYYMQTQVQPGQIWRHYKNKDYRIITISCYSEDLKWYVVYEALYDNPVSKIWHRPLDMFL